MKNPDFEELISAYLDGEVTELERAQIENSPKLLQEVEKLRLITAAITEEIPNNSTQKENHISKAVGESVIIFSQTQPSAAIKGTSLIPFRSAKSASRSPRLSPAWPITAVAAALAIIFAIPLFQSNNESSEPIIVAIEAPETPQPSEATSKNTVEFSGPEQESSSLQADEAAITRVPEEEEVDEIAGEIAGNNASSSEESAKEIEKENIEVEEPESSSSTTVMSESSEQFSTEMINTYSNTDARHDSGLHLQSAQIQSSESFDSFIIELSVPETITDSLAERGLTSEEVIAAKYAVSLNLEGYVGDSEGEIVLPENISDFLVINLAARGVIWTDEDTSFQTWVPSEENIQTDGSSLIGFYLGDFEGNLTFILGMESTRAFRASTASNPPRLIIDIQPDE